MDDFPTHHDPLPLLPFPFLPSSSHILHFLLRLQPSLLPRQSTEDQSLGWTVLRFVYNFSRSLCILFSLSFFRPSRLPSFISSCVSLAFLPYLMASLLLSAFLLDILFPSSFASLPYSLLCRDSFISSFHSSCHLFHSFLYLFSPSFLHAFLYLSSFSFCFPLSYLLLSFVTHSFPSFFVHYSELNKYQGFFLDKICKSFHCL